MICISIPALPPLANRRLMPIITSKGKPGLCARGEVGNFQAGAGLVAQIAMRAQGLSRPLSAPVAAVIVFRLGPKTRRDLDAGIKDALDALTGIVWDDDKQVRGLAVLTRPGDDSTDVYVSVCTASAHASLAGLLEQIQ